MALRRDKQPANPNGTETNELSQNLEGKLNDLIERIEKGFHRLPRIIGDILLKVLQPIVENI